MTDVMLVALVFAGLVARVGLDRRLEENATRLQQRFLAEVADEVATGGSSAFERARRRRNRARSSSPFSSGGDIRVATVTVL